MTTEGGLRNLVAANFRVLKRRVCKSLAILATESLAPHYHMKPKDPQRCPLKPPDGPDHISRYVGEKGFVLKVLILVMQKESAQFPKFITVCDNFCDEV